MSDKPETIAEAMDQLANAWLNIMYEITKPIQALALKCGMRLKPWVQERRDKDEAA